MPVSVSRQLGALGAEIDGIDIREDLSSEDVQSLIRVWLDHLVVVARKQIVDDAALVKFSRNFGVLDRAPIKEQVRGRSFAPGLEEVAIVSNVVENGSAIGALGDGELTWHTDMSYLDNPPPASILCSLEIPEQGGNTWFMNMYSAYDALTNSMKRRIDGLHIKHDASHTSAGTLRKGFVEHSDVRQVPGAIHPIVLKHPKTGRSALYLGRRPHAYIVGLPVDESETLLDELWGHAVKAEFAIQHEWRIGDIVMWDNRCTMHRRDMFDPSARRVLHRTQINASQVF